MIPQPARAVGRLACCVLISTLLRAAPDPPRLRLDGSAYDPARGLPSLPLLEGPADPIAGRASLHLVQLADVPRDAWLEALRGLGVEPLQYLPELSFLVRATPESTDAARRLPCVRWAGPFPPSLKLAPRLRDLAVEAARGWPGRPAKPEPLDVVIQLFDAGDANAFRKFLARAGGREVWLSRPANRVHLRARIAPELLAPIARWPCVFRVEELPSLRLLGEREAVVAAGAFPPLDECVVPGYEAWLARKGARGDGLIVQVMDDGLEQGDASGVAGTAHPDILGGIAGVDNATSDPEADSRAGHGSLNAGLLAGRAVTGFRDGAGFLSGQGVAPGSMVYGTKIFNNLGRFETGPRSFTDLAGRASQHGAAISSNSWGASVFGEYDVLSAEFDALTRDAHPDPGAQPMTFIFAAGNEGDDVPGGVRSIASPATAKNVVSVGAAEGCDSEGRDGCGAGPADADSVRDVARFSSRGPEADGRLGPLIVAPGTHVSSIASTAAGYDGTGVCDPFWPQGQVLYARGSGTSHACPLVAGAAALFHQAFLARTGKAPSPALFRAALAAAAVDLAGGSDGLGGKIEPAPNDVQGWGRLEMEELIPDRNALPRALYFDEPVLLGDTGDEWETIAFPLDPAGPVKVALAWSDPPAVPGASPVLVNDLDLEVESGGQVYRGNVFARGVSAPGGEADRLNNLECVFLETPGPVLRIHVRAAAVAGDGAPAGDGTDQDFGLVVAGGTLQSSRGVVSFRRPAYACDSIVALAVSDLDLKGKPSAQVLVESTAAAQPVVVALTEVSPGTGIFDGTVQLGKEEGQLYVVNGSVLAARYLDGDDGTGKPAEAVASSTVDCAAPAISDVRVNQLSDSGAVVSWTTSEDATGKVWHGSDCGVVQVEAPAPRRSRAQTVTLAGLPAGTRHFFTVSAEDLVGNAATDDHGGTCYSFYTSSPVCGFQDDVELEPAAGWEHQADQGPDDWAPAVFRGARSPTHAWHAAGFDGFKDASLITPPLDIEAGDRFSFWHAFQLEKGYDGAVLEITTNGGATWSDLGPYITRGGYVEIVSGSPLGDRMAWTGQRPEAMTQVEVDLSAWAGSARRIRFRIASDASFADGFGWYLDDVALCRSLNKRAEAALDRAVYRCGDRVHVRVADLDLVGAGAAQVQASSTSHPEPIPVSLAETAPGSGVFAADIVLDGARGGLDVADGDEVTVAYTDQDDGSGGGPNAVTVQASVDCKPPVISGVSIVDLIDDEATIVWRTDEPTIGEVAAGASCDAPAVRVPVPMGGTSHTVTLGGLDPAVTYRYRITARDEAGNVAVDDAGGACLFFRPASVCSVRHDFDDGAPGWTHAAAQGKDGWRLEGSPLARTPPNAWFLPGSDEFSDVSLLSPIFQVQPGSLLAFWHTYDLESTFDGAVVEISADGGPWTDLGPQIRRGAYSSVLAPPNPIAGRRAWSGGGIGPMTRVLIDLGGWAGAFARVRFRAVTDASVAGAGWYIDRVELCQAVREEARVSFDRSAYACGGGAGIRVLDTGRIGLGGARVEVSSTSDPLPEVIELPESPLGSGVFEGAIELTAADAPGALLVREGDAISALYQDENDGTGAPREATAIATVDCRPPEIAEVALEGVTAETALFTWRTDEDAFGRVDLGSACGAFTISESSGMPFKAHRVLVSGLSPGAVYFYRVAATDAAGNAAVDDGGGACRSFRTRVSYTSFSDSIDPAPRQGWDDGGRWRVVESPLARSGSHAWTVDGNGRRADAALTLPPLRAPAGSVLELWQTFELANGLAGGVIEGSRDGGETWIDLEPGIIEGRYTSFLLPGSPLEGRRAWTGGELGPMARVRVALEPLGEGDVLLRFRWVSQGIGNEGSWLIDDVSVRHAVGETGYAGFGATTYSCGSLVTVLVADAGLSGKGRELVEASAPRQAAPLAVEVTEVEPGFFSGSFVISTLETPGSVLAGGGEVLTLTYRDSNAADGAPAVIQSSAAVDCTAPRIRNLRLGAADFSNVEVLWETDEPTRGRVAYGEKCDALGRTSPSASLKTSHRAVLLGLQPGEQALFRVQATDLAGNTASTPDCVALTIEKSCGFDDPLEPPLDGWTHSAALGPDDWSIVEFERSHSPARSFHAPNAGQAKDASLVLPPLDIPPGSVLSFWHTFELEEGFDGALIEVSTDEGMTWKDLGPDLFEGGYSGAISIPAGPVAGWTGGTIKDMTRVSAALDRHAGPGRRIRFRIVADDSVGTPGWYIDDVSVCTFSALAAAPRFARGNCNADALVNLSDAIFLLNHLFLGGREPACRRACDADRSDDLNITDAVYLLNYLFQGGRPFDPPLSCEPELDAAQLDCGAEACAGG